MHGVTNSFTQMNNIHKSNHILTKENLLLNYKKLVKKIIPKIPKIIIIGSSGKCGQGSIEMAFRLGFKKCEMTLWGRAETKKGGPFTEILDHDIFVTCVYINSSGPPILPFLTKPMLEGKRKLSMIVDLSCDPNNANNPIPLYQYTRKQIPLLLSPTQ